MPFRLKLRTTNDGIDIKIYEGCTIFSVQRRHLFGGIMQKLKRFPCSFKSWILGITLALLSSLPMVGAADDLFVDLIDSEIKISFMGPRSNDGVLGVDLATRKLSVGDADPSQGQSWIIRPQAEGLYRVHNAALGEDYALTAAGYNQRLTIAATNSEKWQLWAFRSSSEGYELMNAGTEPTQSILYDPDHHPIPVLRDVGPCCNGYQTWKLFNPAWSPKKLADWSKPISDPPQFFFADDVDETAREGMVEAMRVATEAWGNYGPLEYWVQGADAEAGKDLVQRFCERRVALKNQRMKQCMDRELRGEHSLLSYQVLGATALETQEPRGSAGRNGSAEWGLHRFASSMPWGMLAEPRFGVSGDDEQKVIFHEYFHAVQHAQIHPEIKWEERDQLLGPVWFVEGGAEFMAMTFHAKAQANGSLRIWQNGSGDRTYKAYRKSMGRKFRYAVEAHRQHDCIAEMTQISYDSPCRDFFYDGGSWAIALLVSRHGENVLLDTFYPKLSDMSWNEAFEASFDQTPEAFYQDFEALLNGKVRTAIDILPEIE